MNVNVNSTTPNPTHHVKLSDGSSEIGLKLYYNGRPDPKAIERRPRQSGQFSPFTQSDWSSGRGIKDAQQDRSRYGDGKRVVTRHPGTVMLAGQETFSTGYRSAEANLPGKVTWKSLLTTDRYISYRLTASATGNREAVSFWVRRRGTPTSTLTVEICTETGGGTPYPGTVQRTVTATTTNITDTVSTLYEFVFPSAYGVASGTRYWIKIYTSTADSTTNYWQVAVDAADTTNSTKISSDGASWADASYDLYYRLVDDTDQLGGLFFNFKSGLYFVTRPSGAAAPKLYINGDRGIGTGTHSTTTLQDTTKSWTTNAFAGCVVYIIDGPNSEWSTPYRTIASNTSDTLTFSPAFPRAITDNSQYVILGSNKWTEITGHGLTVLPTGIASSGDVCYFAQGDKTLMRRMREYKASGVWTREFAADTANYAKHLASYYHPTRGLMICKTNDEDSSGKPSFAQAPAQAWGRRLGFPQLLNGCEATTGWTAGAGAAVSLDNAVFVTPNGSIKLVVSSGPANPVAYYATGGISVAGQKAVRFWFMSTANRAAGDVKIFFSTSASAASTIQDLNLPALVANEWQQITLPFNDAQAGTNGVNAIGLRVTAATGTYYIDGIETLPNGSEVPIGNQGTKITGLTTYGDPEVPWVFRTAGAGSIENGVYNPIPLKEMLQAENIHNGMGNAVHNVYLYFSFLHGLERFYRNNLDDVGPNRDEGLPDGRRGFITSMQGYIGRFFYNYDCQEGYSAIFESASGTDHHEIYRCDTAGKRIRNLWIQVIPGDIADRLWFTEGDDICWLPLPGNTLKEDTDDTFLVTHEGVLETGWIYGGESDAVKLFSAVKLFTENTTSNRKIEWDYKKDEDTTWTNVSTAFTTPPVQEVDLNVSCKRLKLRFRLQTNDNTETPIIRSMVVSATTRPEIRYTYTMNSLLADYPTDLEGEEENRLVSTDLALLDGWCAANTILTMSCVFSPMDNRTVFLEPVVTRPHNIVYDESDESLYITLNLIEP